jgi:muconolactone delta-isomerase
MRFLVKSWLKTSPTAEVMALMPAEQARGEALDKQGIREALYLAADQSTAWQVLQCDSRAALEETLQSLPLHDYCSFEVTLLA